MQTTAAATASPREGRARSCTNIFSGCSKRGLAMSIVCGSISPGPSSTASAPQRPKPSEILPLWLSLPQCAIALTSNGYYPRIRLPDGVHLTLGRHAVSKPTGALTTQTIQDGAEG